MDPLGQLYLLTTFLGWGFIIACFALGQVDHGQGGVHGDGTHLGHDGGVGHGGVGHGGVGHGGAGHGIAHSAQHLAHGAHGAHGAEMHLDGHGLGHARGDGHVSTGHGQNGGHGHSNGNGHNHSNDDAHTSVNPIVRSRENRLYFTLISLLSPMTISIFAGFFGSVGFVTWHYAPWLGYITLVPAIGAAIIGTELVKRAMAAFATKLASSSLTRRDEAIGRIAQVNTPIMEGRLGEVSYVIGTTRFNSSARAAQPGQDFQRGTKVMIVETDGAVVYVEPAKDIDLLN